MEPTTYEFEVRKRTYNSVTALVRHSSSRLLGNWLGHLPILSYLYFGHLRTSRRTGIIIYECLDVPVQSFTSVEMYLYSHLRVSRCTGTIIYECQDVPVQSFTRVKMYRYNHLRVSRCTSTIIYECRDVPVQSFTIVKMCRYNHVWESRCTGTIIYESQAVPVQSFTSVNMCRYNNLQESRCTGTSVSKNTSNGLDDRDFVPSSRLAPKPSFFVLGIRVSSLSVTAASAYN
jgi:hypothetical protein